MLDRLKSLLPQALRRDEVRIPVVRLQGVIGAGTALRPGLSLQAVGPALEKAFAVKKAPAVALLINSPGGSAVQSHLIHQRIRQLAAENEKTVIAYLEDVAASGGYMIAVAADEIVTDPSSIVGSIGVISATFGLDRLIARWDVDRRVYTAGSRKGVLDPFQPENPDDVEHLKSIQRDIHRHFIDLVKGRRGASLTGGDELFTGLFWGGEEARALGLVDRVGTMHADLKARFGDKVKAMPVSAERGFLRRRLAGMAAGGPMLSVDEALSAAEIRAIYARYGL